MLLVDARGRRRRGSEVLRGRVPLTIGIGSDFVDGEIVDAAIAIPSAVPMGAGRHEAERGPLEGNDWHATHGSMAGIAVAAPRHGRFMTERRIGDTVRGGEIVGGLGNEFIRAPAGGVLLGLAARGARIEPGDTLVEVDPGGVAFRCYGVGEGPRRIAACVVSTFAGRVDPAGAPDFQAGAVAAPLLMR